jgi:hypothetical protein
MNPVSGKVLTALQEVLITPSLEHARNLESLLASAGYLRRVFGRRNQSASLEANAESDRGVAERLANAFDASLSAARIASGDKSDRSLTPRAAALRYFNPDPDKCEWNSGGPLQPIHPPKLQFWEEIETRHRFRKYEPEDGLATVAVKDSGRGLARETMADTILTLNSDAKLQEWEAIGRYGHGGSSSLFFCESALVMTMPRFSGTQDQVCWTIIYPEQEADESKQDLLRKWFAEEDGHPLTAELEDIPKELRGDFPGTSIFHFGYHRGGWIQRIRGPEQSNPWGRLGRLFFSYPLPYIVTGSFARGDSPNAQRTITSPYSRLRAASKSDDVQYCASEKREALVVKGVEYGRFSFVAFVTSSSKEVRNYVDPQHPVVLTLNGQNHGEMTRTLLVNANLPELASSMILEVRLDGLEQEALSNIILNSREFPKPTVFTDAIRERLIQLLKDDDSLQAIEKQRQEQKARESNQQLNKSLSSFIKSILSDAAGAGTGGGAGEGPGGGGGAGKPRPVIGPADPPSIIEFLYPSVLHVPEGATYIAKFKTDARPPKYSFGGDNPRLFVRYIPDTSPLATRISVVGTAEINDRGYGSISVSCLEDFNSPVLGKTATGRLELKLQSVDGSVLTATLEVGVAPKPTVRERPRVQDVKVEVNFCAPDGDPQGILSQLILEEKVTPFGAYLSRFKDAMPELPAAECTYWGEKYEREGTSVLAVEINVANPTFVKMMHSCSTAEERVICKERYCRDVVLDAYQHAFRLGDIPDQVWSAVQGEEDDSKKAAELFLNHDKAIRFAVKDRTGLQKDHAHAQ